MLRGGQATVPKYFRSHGFPEDPQTTYPGPSHGSSGDTEALAEQWSSEYLRQNWPWLPPIVPTPPPTTAQGPPPRGPHKDQPLPRSPGTKK